MPEQISFEDFKKLEIKIGKVLSAEKVEGTDKLLKLSVDVGNEESQLVAGVAHVYAPEELVGKEVVVLTNIEPRKLKGVESLGMILAAVEGDKPVLLVPERDVKAGTAVR